MNNSLLEFKNKQKIKLDPNLADKAMDEIFTGNEYHDYFRRIPFLKLRSILKKNGISLSKGSSLHVASCGTGIDVYYLKKILNIEADITVTDFSEDAVSVTRRIFPDVKGEVQDNESLSYPDDFFDFSYIAAALHHLPRPNIGLYELLRVSRYCLFINEPNDSLLTRLATKFGFAKEIEESGNFVYRYSKREVQKIARSLFMECDTARYFATHRIARGKIEFLILKLLNALGNLFFPFLGNQITFVIIKKRK